MAKKKGSKKRQLAEEIQQQGKTPVLADFTTHLNEGREDFPYQRGTMQDLGNDFADEFGVATAKTPSSQAGGMIAFVVLVAVAAFCMLTALEPLA